MNTDLQSVNGSIHYLALAIQAASRLKCDVMIPIQTAKIILDHIKANPPVPVTAHCQKCKDDDCACCTSDMDIGECPCSDNNNCALYEPPVHIPPNNSPPPLVVCPACASKLDRLHEVHDCIPPSAYDTGCELAIPVTMLTSHEVNERYYGKRIGRVGF